MHGVAGQTERAHLRLVRNVAEHFLEVGRPAPRAAALREDLVDAVVQVRSDLSVEASELARRLFGTALATRPKLLLLDEVAAGLTEAEVEEMARLIRRMRDELDLAVVWIEHVVRALTACVDRLICLAGGHIIGDGEPGDVLGSPAVREVFLGTEATAESLAAAGWSEGPTGTNRDLP